MYAINSPDYSDLIRWAEEISAIMTQRNRNDLVNEIKQCVNQLQKDSFTIAVIGKAKRGKSTLINALMGRHDDTLAPIDKLPASSAIPRFQWGETEKAEVFFQDNHRESVSWSDIRNYVTEEKNPSNRKGVSTVSVSGPIPGLKNRIELVDTPGAGSVHEYHDALLHAFIPQADAIIFIVTARMPLDNDELELLREVKKADISKIFFVINRIDEIENPEDLENAISHNQALLEQNGILVNQFYKISAKRAFKGESDSGFTPLADALESFLKNDRAKIQRQRFIARVCSIIEPELQNLAITIDSATKTAEQIEADIQALRDETKKMESQRKTSERKFSMDWSNAVSELQRGVSQTEREVKERLYQEIDSHSVLGVSSLCKKLPTILVTVTESGLQSVTAQFESRAQAICQELQVSYPVLELGIQSRPNLRVGSNAGAWVTTAAGTAAAAGGVALVSAGASAAATIAAANAAAAAAATTAVAAGAAGGTALGVGTIASIAGGAWALFTGDIIGGALIAETGAAVAAATAAPVAATTGTAAVATTATPLWVALSGPVGWTIAGLGVVAIPFAWSISKNRQKNKLQEAAEKKIEEIFKRIREERIPQLREMGNSILLSFQNSLDSKIEQTEATLNAAKQNRPPEAELNKMKSQNEQLRKLMEQVQTL